MELSVNDAAQHLGISPDTVRRRIRRGEIQATKQPRPQGFKWTVTVGDATFDPGQGDQGDQGELVTALQERITAQERILDARGEEIRELHRLLAAGALEAGKRRPWWKLWR